MSAATRERGLEAVIPAAMPTWSGVDALIEACALTGLQTGPIAARARARHALFLERAGDPEP